MHSGIEIILLWTALLLLISVLASKVSTLLGIPALLVFLVIGMLAGSEGPGGIYFDDPWVTQLLGVVALVLILFSGGLDTSLQNIRPVLRHGLVLSTVGVLITALVIGWFATVVLNFTFKEGVLLGAIVSCTDAAAVFSVLRGKNIGLKGGLGHLLELESGSNDPMAIFLTLGMIRLIDHPDVSALTLIPMFFQQMILGGVFGFLAGKLTVRVINRLHLEYEGLYPVLTIALILFTYGVTTVLGGNGFLAVYLAGVLVGNSTFIHKASLLRFHEGLAWLMQIAMFLTLGLLVFPSHLNIIAGRGLLLAVCLILVARPLSVFLALIGSGLTTAQKTLVAWVGLRGAAPIILATFPLLAEVSNAVVIFNLVFFIVLTSMLVQGTTLGAAAKLLKVNEPAAVKPAYPIEIFPAENIKSELVELIVPAHSRVAGRPLVNLKFPDGALVVLLGRNNEYLVPGGGTTLQAGDVLLVLAPPDCLEKIRTTIESA